LWGMIYELDCVFFNVLSEAVWLVGWIPWHIYNKKEKEKEKSHFWSFHWITGLLASLSIECSLFTSKSEKFGLVKVMTSLVL
jgi:hypothetical protein